MPKSLITLFVAILFSSCGGGNSSASGGGGGGHGGGGVPTPSLSLVAPASMQAGILISGLTAYGEGFYGDSQVLIDGQPASTTYVDSGTLQVAVDTSLSATPGVHQFSVNNRGLMSNTLPYTVYTPAQAPMVMKAFPGFLVSEAETDPTFSASGDINGDGLADIVMQGPGTGTGSSLALLFGQANGTLSAPQYVPIPEAPFNLAIADVDGDGTADLVLVISDNAQSTSVSVMFGDGHGNFQQPVTQQTFPGFFPFQVHLEDLDGDGKPDLLLNVESVSGTSGTLQWLKNTGGGFAAPAVIGTYAADSGYFCVADFNLDGKPDIFHLAGDSTFHIEWNQGNGKFNDQSVASLNGFTRGVPVAFDFNLDGAADLALQVPQNLGATLYVFAGDGKGGFTQVFSTGLPAITNLLAGDFDHDGFPDLAGMAGDASAISFFFGDGEGNFTNQKFVGPVAMGMSLATADFNGDGLPDLVFADQFSFVTLILGRMDRNFPSPLALHPATVQTLSTGDINGDGMPDILAGGDYVDGIPGTIFLNQGGRSFQLAAYTDPTSFALADFTGKGVVDLVGGATGVEIWPNNLTPNFSSSPINVAPSTSDVTIADMDGDGHNDFTSACEDLACAAQVFYGNGAYQFTALTVPNFSGPYVVGDFNGDGKMDLAEGIVTFLNEGNRSFQAVQNSNLNLSHADMTIVADFNGDGKDDVAINLPGERYIAIYYSKGDGTFYIGTEIDPGDYPGAFAVGDFDGDGRMDLAVGLALAHQVCIFFNAGDSQFTESCFASGAPAAAMAAADLNADGKPDLIIGNSGVVNILFHK